MLVLYLTIVEAILVDLSRAEIFHSLNLLEVYQCQASRAGFNTSALDDVADPSTPRKT